MATTLSVAQRLAEARAAYHALMTGTAAVDIWDATGERVTYNEATAAGLRGYISQLEAEAAGLSSTAPGRPMGVWF
jgi:hypothetical protein